MTATATAFIQSPEPRIRRLANGYVLVENLEVGVYFGEDDLEVTADAILPPIVAGPSRPSVEIVIHGARTFPGGLRVDPIDWTEEQRDHVEEEIFQEALLMASESGR